MTTLRRVALTAAATLTLVASVGVPAQAASVKTGTKVSGPGSYCDDTADNAKNSHVKVCFAPYGDKLYVYDGSKDGRSSYGEFDSGWEPSTVPCRNKYGYKTWVVCDYDVTEGRPAKFRGYTQDNEGMFNPRHDVTGWAYDMNVNGQS